VFIEIIIFFIDAIPTSEKDCAGTMYSSGFLLRIVPAWASAFLLPAIYPAVSSNAY
jgi:hypothetical protein